MPKIRFAAYIDEQIIKRVDELMHDNTTGKRRYGMRSTLVEGLLLRWIKEQEAKRDRTLDDI